MAGQVQSTIFAAFIALLCLGYALCEVQPDRIDEPQKRGGARPFFGFGGSGNKRLSDVQPYYLYEKRGGGRAFFGAWNDYPVRGQRLERRGGGRAFSGSWGPAYPASYYESPYFHKRSSNLWEFLQGNNDAYRK